MERGKRVDIEEIDTIITEIEISKGKGNLLLCVVNSPAYRNKIIQILKRRFLLKENLVTNGNQIISTLKIRDFDKAELLIWIMPEKPDEDIFIALNNFRELFYEVKIPNLVFYTRSFSEQLIKKAPDFFRYRGNYYELKDDEKGISFKALEALDTHFFYQGRDDLERRKKINEYLLKNVKNKKEKSKILNELGTIFYYLGEYDKAIEYYNRALKIVKDKLGDKHPHAIDLMEKIRFLKTLPDFFLPLPELNK